MSDVPSSASSSNIISRELMMHQQAHVRSSSSSSNSSGDDSEPVHRNCNTSGETPALWGDSYRSLMFGSESDSGSEGSEGSGSKHHVIGESHNSDSDREHSSSTSQSYHRLHTVQCEQQAVQLSQQQQQQQQQVSAQDGSCSGAYVAADSALQSGESPLTHNGASLHSDLFSSESAEAALFTSEHRSACSSAVSYSDSSSSSSVLDEENDRCASGSVAEAAAAYAYAGEEEHKACDSYDDGEALAQELTSNSSAYNGNSRGIKSRGSIDSNATFDSSAAEELRSSSAQQEQDCHDTNEVQCMHYYYFLLL
jgi:hypothetical protein